jgi:hypothetical protein
MLKQAFQPIEHDINKMVKFYKRQEIADSVLNAVKTANSHARNNGNKSGSLIKQKPSNKGGFWKGQDNVTKSNKHKHNDKCASFNGSNGCNGCCLHLDATSHTTADCKVMQSQTGNMKGVYKAQASGYNLECQKKMNNKTNLFKTSGGHLHALLDDVEHIKA